MSDAKNHKSPLAGIPWWHAMLAHCLIHAGMVIVITGSVWMALAELFIHYAIDYAKCGDWISFNQDQAIHYGCKILWAFLICHP